MIDFLPQNSLFWGGKNEEEERQNCSKTKTHFPLLPAGVMHVTGSIQVIRDTSYHAFKENGLLKGRSLSRSSSSFLSPPGSPLSPVPWGSKAQRVQSIITLHGCRPQGVGGRRKGSGGFVTLPPPHPLGCCQSPSVWAFDSANSQGVGAGRPEPCFRPPQHRVLSVQTSACHISFPWCALRNFKGLLLVHRGHRAKVNWHSLTSPSPTKEKKRGEKDF